MQLNSINSTSFGKLYVKQDAWNVHNLKAILKNDRKILASLEDSFARIDAKSGNTDVLFSSYTNKNERILRITDEEPSLSSAYGKMDCDSNKVLVQVRYKDNASPEKVIRAFNELADKMPRRGNVHTLTCILGKYR